MSDYSVKVISWSENCPEGVIISGTGIGNDYYHPVRISKFEFFRLFDEMALVAERLILYEQMRDTLSAVDDKREREKIKGKMEKINFNWLYSSNYHDAISLYFKMRRLEQGYSEYFKEGKKNWLHPSKHEDRMHSWLDNACMIYRKMILNDEMD